jgi:mannose-1-phosphate guanylyltransferase / mannose-6-phosphate isomerase
VLVADIRDGQRVKEAVDLLKARGAPQATEFPRCHRPWGWYETLALGPRFQVKRIMVHPGGRLSLQSHVHRAEHWVVVAGTAKVTVGETVRLVAENESIYVPLGAVHRLENPGRVDIHLIEVQTGAYLGEDDITRLEDVYARA